MNGTEKVVKHLEMTQTVINRLGRNSFWVKSWGMILIVAAMVLIAKQEMQNSYFVLVLILPALGVLDSGRILSLAGEVVSTGIQRNQSSIRYRFRDESYEAQK